MTYIYVIIKQLLTYVSVDMEYYWTVNVIILTTAPRFSAFYWYHIFALDYVAAKAQNYSARMEAS